MRLRLRLLTAAAALLFTVAVGSNVRAADLIYVTLSNNTVVRYDATGNDGTAIAASAAVFVNTNLSSPRGLAFDDSGILYVANSGNNTISKYNSAGTYLSNITGNLSEPRGLAFDSSGNLFAANSTGNTISKFNSAGAYLSNIATNLNNPRGLAFDASGNLYAANGSGSTISKFNSAGTYVSNITTNLNNPWGLAFDASGNLYAANTTNSTISKFNSAGTYLSNITTNLSTPWGLAFDTSGNLYAANFGNSTISKFDSSGNFLTSWSTGSTPRFLAFQPVPEPSTYALGGICALTMGYIARRRKARRQDWTCKEKQRALETGRMPLGSGVIFRTEMFE